MSMQVTTKPRAATLTEMVKDAFRVGGRGTVSVAGESVVAAADAGVKARQSLPVRERERFKNRPALPQGWDADLASRVDNTLLNPALMTDNQLSKTCEDAAVLAFRAVCTWPCFVKEARRLLAGTNVPIAAVVGFPEGLVSTATSAGGATAAKMREAKAAIRDGASEIDVVANSSLLLQGYEATQRGELPLGYTKYWRDTYLVVAAAANAGRELGREVVPKCIMQTENLRKQMPKYLPKTATDVERAAAQELIVRQATQLTLRAFSEAVDMSFVKATTEMYLKTSCGVYSVASLPDVKIFAEETKKMNELRAAAGRVPLNVCIKVAGGVANKKQAREYIDLVRSICGDAVKVIFGTSSGVDVASKEAPPPESPKPPTTGNY